MFCLVFIPQTLFAEAKSVYEISPVRDYSIIAGTGIGTGLVWLFRDSLVSKRCPCDPGEINSLDQPNVGNNSHSAGRLADLLIGISLTLPVAVDYIDAGWSQAFYEDMVIYAQVFSVNGFLVTTTKYLTGRPYPNVYARPDHGAQTTASDYTSFYSGHTSNSFSALAAMSMTQTLRHGFNIWPWLLTVAMGTTVGSNMVLAGHHFPTDIIVGGIMGLGVGILVPYFHIKKIPTNISFYGDENQFNILWTKYF